MNRMENPRTTRWLFVLAGACAMFVTLVRAIAGARADLAPVQAALAETGLVGVVRINWHALTAVFASLSVALFVASRASRGAARAVGCLAGVAFGATCGLFLAVSAQLTGSPFTWFPWIPLAVTSLVSVTAAARA